MVGHLLLFDSASTAGFSLADCGGQIRGMMWRCPGKGGPAVCFVSIILSQNGAEKQSVHELLLAGHELQTVEDGYGW